MNITKNNTLFTPIIKVYYALISEIRFISIGYENIATVTFVHGAEWKELYATIDSIKFSENMKKTDAGNFIEQTLEFKNPGVDIINDNLLNQLSSQFLIFKIDTIEQSKLIGTIENPAVLSLNSSTANFDTTKTVIVSRKSSEPAYFI